MVRDGTVNDDEDLQELQPHGREAWRGCLGSPSSRPGDVHFQEPEDEVYRHILLRLEEVSGRAPCHLLPERRTKCFKEFAYLGEEKGL